MAEKQKVVTSFYTDEEVLQIGFKSIGKNVKISKKASIYSPEKISIGDNVRIDDFCILSGNILLGSNLHISSYVALYGTMGIVMEDYTGISARSTIYSAMDDFGGNYLMGPIHDESMTHVSGGPVIVRKYSQIGAHCLVFPNIEIKEGTVLGACSMLKTDTDAWSIYVGIPAVKKKCRSNNLLHYFIK